MHHINFGYSSLNAGRDGYRVECTECSAMQPAYDLVEADARAAWNRRSVTSQASEGAGPDDFAVGMAVAAGIAISAHGAETVAEEILRAGNLDILKAMRVAGVDRYDIRLCLPVLKHIRDKSASRRQALPGRPLMTTLDRNSFLAGKLREFYQSHPGSTELLEAANALDALSSLPAQAVGVSAAAWKCEFFRADPSPRWWPEVWLSDPREFYGDTLVRNVKPLYLALSQPAAVGVTDEMVELRAAAENAVDALVALDERMHDAATHKMQSATAYGPHQKAAVSEAVDRLEAALRSTP